MCSEKNRLISPTSRNFSVTVLANAGSDSKRRGKSPRLSGKGVGLSLRKHGLAV